MLKNLASLTHTVENKVCQFICENDTPIAIIKEALFQFQKYIGVIEDAAKAQQTPAAPVAPEEPVSPSQNLEENKIVPIESAVAEEAPHVDQ